MDVAHGSRLRETVFLEALSQGLGQVGHVFALEHAPGVHPRKDLVGTKALLAPRREHLLPFVGEARKGVNVRGAEPARDAWVARGRYLRCLSHDVLTLVFPALSPLANSSPNRTELPQASLLLRREANRR